MRIVYGGDSFLNDQTMRDLCHKALTVRPDAELIELDATNTDQYAFDEAVSPSLLSDTAVVQIKEGIAMVMLSKLKAGEHI